MASSRGSVSEVITFNWDNLLELFLSYHGFVTDSVYEETHWANSVDVTVLHPHGYIPINSKEKCSADIVFDQLSYSNVIGDTSRPWRQRLLTILRTHTCLFIGLSGDDPNLDSLLCSCKPQHASRGENTLFWGVRLSTSTDEIEANIWENRGIFCKIVSNYEQELPEIIFNICQRAALKRLLNK